LYRKAFLIRFADDFVCAFEKLKMPTFLRSIGKRLGKFGLELSAEKTRIIPFSSAIQPGKASFDFLGFEFRWGKGIISISVVNQAGRSEGLRFNSLAFWVIRSTMGNGIGTGIRSRR